MRSRQARLFFAFDVVGRVDEVVGIGHDARRASNVCEFEF